MKYPLTNGSVPSVGIVIPAYNAEKHIEETLRNIQSQLFTDWFCVCVDDGSKDGTASIAEKMMEEDERFHLVRQANAGTSAARNRGYQYLHPETPFICFADGDDLWTPNALQLLRDELIAHPDAMAAYGLAEYIDSQGQKTNLDWVSFPDQGRDRVEWRDNRIVPLALEEPTSFFSLVVKSRVFPPSTLLARNEGYRRIGLFDPEITMIEDWDLWIRLSRLGDFRFINQVITLYRQHESQMTKSNARIARSVAYLSAKSIFSPLNTPEQKKAAIAGYRFREKGRMKEKWDHTRKNWKQPKSGAISFLQTLGHLVRYTRGQPGNWG